MNNQIKQNRWRELCDTYDRVAEHYVKEFFDELSRKPFDRKLLDRFASSVQGTGRVCEIGCGPGQIARYLKDRGVDVFGLDLSPEMVVCARRLNPDIDFEQGNMLEMGVATKALVGIVAFYSIIHLQRSHLSQAFDEFCRVLQPGGNLFLAFHGGSGEEGTDNWFGEPVSVTATLFEPDEVAGVLESSGFKIQDILERPPYDFEYQSRRIYLFADKGGS